MTDLPHASPNPAKPSLEELQAFLLREFPQSRATVEALGPMTATLRLRVTDADLRPGGTVSGPSMMGVADAALYIAILGEIGIVPLAVTTNLTINFLRKPRANCDLLGKCRMIKIGRTQAVGEVSLYSDGDDQNPVAHVVGTYAIPR
ncbi:Thioesterase family protein [gamma proteobacterium HdN1]|nr:Thioesterase family protein [gamma proteobacterium HdN1]